VISIVATLHSGPHVIREIEVDSLRKFVEAQRRYLRGRVLDFGAGKPGTCRQPQPYRDLIEGEYVPYDLGDQEPAGPFDAILCTQVIQYLDEPLWQLGWFRAALRRGGYLVMTWPTNWDEVEESDRWRFTKSGMQRLFDCAGGWRVLVCERRAEVKVGAFTFPLGYGVAAIAV
jgi:SAM-dependent methyltransferase